MNGGSPIHLVLGPATLALAVPLHRQAHHLREMALPLVVALPAGALVSIGSAVLTVRALGGSEGLEHTIAPKAATTPVAIAIADHIGGVPALVAAFTMLAGMLGAVFGPWLLDRMGVQDRRVRGLAMGAASHGVGTSRSLHDHLTEGAFAGLAMGLTALLTSVLVPLASVEAPSASAATRSASRARKASASSATNRTTSAVAPASRMALASIGAFDS